MTFVLILLVAGLVGGVAMYAPSALLASALFVLRLSSSPQILRLADSIDTFFDLHGIKYEPPYRMSARKSGNRWIQAILAPIAVFWKYASFAIGVGVAIWLFE